MLPRLGSVGVSHNVGDQPILTAAGLLVANATLPHRW